MLASSDRQARDRGHRGTPGPGRYRARSMCCDEGAGRRSCVTGLVGRTGLVALVEDRRGGAADGDNEGDLLSPGRTER